MLTLIETGTKTAKENMEIDQSLLETLDPSGPAILHFYDWKEPSITYGYFMKPGELLNLSAVEEEGICIARRPTGGGVVFHLWDLAFSVLIPAEHPHFSENPLLNYQYINQKIQAVCRDYLTAHGLFDLLQEETPPPEKVFENFCMAKPTQYDVMVQGKKIAGAAQRKKKQGYLHQGTISIARPIEHILRNVLSKNPALIDGMYQTSFYLLQEGWRPQQLAEVRTLLKGLIHQSFVESKSSSDYNAPLAQRGTL